MGVGLCQLAAYSKENLPLNYKPDITFFKTIHKKHADFRIECINQYFLRYLTFKSKATTVISHNADLINKMYLVLKLPPIPPVINQETGLIDDKVRLRYCDFFSFKLIKSIEFEVNGKIINTLKGEYMYTQYVLSNLSQRSENNGGKRSLDNMLGNIPQMTDFTVSKDSYKLWIPIDFWFTRHYQMAFPLCALDMDNIHIKVNVELNTLEDILIYGPTHYVTINESCIVYTKYSYLYQYDPNGNIYAIIQYYFFDDITKKLYFNPIKGSLSSTLDIVDHNNISSTINGDVLPSNIAFNYNMNMSNSYLAIDYIFLDKDERKYFEDNELVYVIDLVDYYKNNNITNINNSFNLGFKNPCIELIFTLQYQWMQIIKEYFNYTDFVDPTSTLIKSCSLLMNGTEMFSQINISFFNFIQLFQHHRKMISTKQTGINVISFSLHPDKLQPSGSINLSKGEQNILQLTTIKGIGNTSNNKAIVNIYSRYYNVMVIKDSTLKILF